MSVELLREAKLARQGLIFLEIHALNEPKLIQKRIEEVRPENGDPLEVIENLGAEDRVEGQPLTLPIHESSVAVRASIRPPVRRQESARDGHQSLQQVVL